MPRTDRHAEPRSPNARDAVRLMRGGASFRQVADALGITVQAVEKFWLRWIVLPENEALRAEVERLKNPKGAST